MRIQLLLYVQMVLALILMWTCFCRSVKTDRTTHREVRWAIVFEGVAAGLVLGAPLMPVVMHAGGNYWTPSWPAWSTPSAVWLVLLFAVTTVQLVTAKYWQAGRAPLAFQQPMARGNGGLVFAAMLLVVGGANVLPAHAEDSEPQWREVPGDVVYLPPDSELKCTHPKGCVAFTVDGLQELLKKAGGTCGRIPPLQRPKGSDV